MKKSQFNLFTPLFLVIGLVCIGFGLSDLNMAIKSESWPQTECIITKSKLNYSISTNSGSSTLILEYTYAVSNVTYINDNIAWGGVSSDTVEKNRYTRMYKKGSNYSVFYNPDNPEESVLMPGIKFQSISLAIFGIGLSILSFIPLIFARLKNESK